MKGAGKLLAHVVEQMKAAGFEPDDKVIDGESGEDTGHTVLDVIQYTQGFATSEVEYDITKREGWTENGPYELRYDGRKPKPS